jgi:E3 ubiquitin-protein ligase UBR7
MQPEHAAGRSTRRCALNPPDRQPQLPNDDNVYSKNFAGRFCRCGRDYNPETEEEAMLNCIACEVRQAEAAEF